MKHLVWIIVLVSACATAPPDIGFLAPPPLPLAKAVRYGINDGFHGPLLDTIAARYVDYGGDIVVRTPQVSKHGLNQFLLSVVTLPILTVALIEGPDVGLARDFATFVSLAAIENGNELELPPHELTPTQYADAQAEMAATERAAGFRGDILMGGVYALTDETKFAITRALARCADCLVTVHLYTISAEDVDWLNALNADIAITETGSPTGCGMSRWREQADYLAHLRAMALYIRRLKYFLVYQRPSGAGCTDLDTFGIEGKPAESLLESWVRR